MIQKYTRDTSDEMIEAGWRHALDYIACPLYIPGEGIIEILKQSIVPDAKKANPDQFIDNSLVNELDDARLLSADRHELRLEYWSVGVLEY